MGTRQTRLLSPTPAALAGFRGRLVQLVLTDGEVVRGMLEPGSSTEVLALRPSRRGPVRVVPLASVRELIADLDANR